MVFVETPSLTETTLPVPTVVAILFVRSVSSLAESSDFDLTKTGPSVLLACTALYVTEDRSPNTCTYRQFQPRSESNSQSCLPILSLFFNPSSFSLSDPHQFPSKALKCREADIYSPVRFASIMRSEGTRTTDETPVFLPAGQIDEEFSPGGSICSLSRENTKDKTDSAGYETV